MVAGVGDEPRETEEGEGEQLERRETVSGPWGKTRGRTAETRVYNLPAEASSSSSRVRLTADWTAR